MQLQAAKDLDGETMAGAFDTPPVSRRDELLIMATERFCGTENHDRLSVDQYREAFRALCGTADPETLELLAKILSQTPFTPRDVCLYLAMEEMPIARHILRYAMPLGQLDMVQIIGKCGTQYAREIATRPDLGPSLVRHLKLLGDSIVNENIAANPALTSASTEKPDTSSTDISEQILRRTRSQQKRKAARPEISYTVTRTRNSKPAVAASDVKNIETVSASVPSSRSAAEKTLLEAAARAGKLSSKQDKNSSQPVTQRTPAGRPGDHEFGRGMEKAALAHSRQGMTVLMQKQYNLTAETCNQILEDKTGDTLAVMLKAARISDALANRITLLTFPTIGLSVQNATRAVRFYKQLDYENCKDAISQWPKMSSGTHRHVPVEQETAADRRRLDIGETPDLATPFDRNEKAIDFAM